MSPTTQSILPPPAARSESTPLSPPTPANDMVNFWTHPVVISETNFKFKSLSSFGLNIAVGCNHGCRFCYVPDTSTKKQASKLANYGVSDPDSQWGEYVLLRTWDGKRFDTSLKAAQQTAPEQLKPDGNRAVMLCTTTDPYQVLKANTPELTKELNRGRRRLVRTSLRRIRSNSDLNVRILTRSPLAMEDFALFKTFGNRLVYGMSVPTLNNELARIYEPNAPAPSQRLKTLQRAVEAGLHVYVAIAPTYPECDEADIRATIQAVKSLGAVTIFHEPINMRAENVARIEAHAKSLGRSLKTEVFATPEAWRRYAFTQLALVQRIAEEEGVADHLHLWPDSALLVKKRFQAMMRGVAEGALGRAMTQEELTVHSAEVAKDYEEARTWITTWHQRISEWPGKPNEGTWIRPAVPTFITRLLPASDESERRRSADPKPVSG